MMTYGCLRSCIRIVVVVTIVRQNVVRLNLALGPGFVRCHLIGIIQ